MQPLLQDIRTELRAHKDPVYRSGFERFFKEPVELIGVRTPITRKIAARFWRQAKGSSKADVFALCEALMKQGTFEETMIAFAWLRRIESQVTVSDFARYERWLKRYVTNWAHCDEFCTHALGSLIYQFPELKPKLFDWTRSKNRWLRRAAAVTQIYACGKPNLDLAYLFGVADALLEDEDDLVQKGYGWMLKVASQTHRDEVFAYVMDRKDRLPRTALRYAIEKLPRTLKQQAMK